MTKNITPTQRLLFLEVQIGIIRRMSRKLNDSELSELLEVLTELNEELRENLTERTS